MTPVRFTIQSDKNYFNKTQNLSTLIHQTKKNWISHSYKNCTINNKINDTQFINNDSKNYAQI